MENKSMNKIATSVALGIFGAICSITAWCLTRKSYKEGWGDSLHMATEMLKASNEADFKK